MNMKRTHRHSLQNKDITRNEFCNLDEQYMSDEDDIFGHLKPQYSAGLGKNISNNSNAIGQFSDPNQVITRRKTLEMRRLNQHS